MKTIYVAVASLRNDDWFANMDTPSDFIRGGMKVFNEVNNAKDYLMSTFGREIEHEWTRDFISLESNLYLYHTQTKNHYYLVEQIRLEV